VKVPELAVSPGEFGSNISSARITAAMVPNAIIRVLLILMLVNHFSIRSTFAFRRAWSRPRTRLPEM